LSARASSFGRRAEEYERSRPDYGPEPVEFAAARLDLGADAHVLDLGAGTGKLTRRLVERFAAVTAVEPDVAMRALIAGSGALAGSAESIPLPDRSLVLIWRDWWKTDPPPPKEARELMRQVYERPDLERHAGEDDAWRACFEGSPFEELTEENLAPEVLDLDAERLVTLILSTSVFGSLPADEFDRVEGELRRMITGDYRLPVQTQLWWTRLRA